MSVPASPLAARLALHIRSTRMAPGTHLADALAVSRAPIRRAHAVPAARGVVGHEPRRGYFVRRVPAARSAAATAEVTDPIDGLYLRIADDRLAGRLAPDVTESAPMRRHRIAPPELQRSRRRMRGNGWVGRETGRVWRFLALPETAGAHGQSHRFRMTFEAAALLEPGFRIEPRELERIRRDQRMLLEGGVQRLSRARLVELGSDFHETPMAISGNRFAGDAFRRVNSMHRLLEYRAHYDRDRFTQQCREHLHLPGLLEAGARDAAATFLRRHLDVVRAIKTEPAGAPRPTAPQRPTQLRHRYPPPTAHERTRP